MAAKTQSDTLTPTIVIVLLLITAIIAYWLGFAGQRYSTITESLTSESQTTEIRERDDLNQSSDDLDTVNLDAVDQGLNGLQTEVPRY